MKTSLSVASLQMGRCCLRQKSLLQVAQVEEACEGDWVDSAMMVLLVKQVHLQNEGGAG